MLDKERTQGYPGESKPGERPGSTPEEDTVSIVDAPAKPETIPAARAINGTRLDLHAPGCGPDCGEVEKCDVCGGPMCFMHDDADPVRVPEEWTTSLGYLGGYNHKACAI